MWKNHSRYRSRCARSGGDVCGVFYCSQQNLPLLLHLLIYYMNQNAYNPREIHRDSTCNEQIAQNFVFMQVITAQAN